MEAAPNADQQKLAMHPMEQTRRLAMVRAEFARIWNEQQDTNAAGLNTLRIMSAMNGTHCLTNPTLCEFCFALDQGVGYFLIELTRLTNSVASTSPQYWNNLNYLYAQYQYVQTYITNTSIPARFGNSVTLPVRWPARSVSNQLDYIDMPLPEVGFSDIEDLISATWAYIKSVLPDLGNPANWFSAANTNGTLYTNGTLRVTMPNTNMAQVLLRGMGVDAASLAAAQSVRYILSFVSKSMSHASIL